MPRFTHTIGPVALDRAAIHRDLTDGEADLWAKAIGTALHVFEPGIGTWASAYFLGQVLHESGELRFTRELWGPTPAQAGYWRRRELQGDGPLFEALGYRYRGGGLIQVTGRQNFRGARADLVGHGIDVPSARWLADHSGEPLIAALISAAWWARHFPNDMSGPGWDVERVTRIVNGGTNGLAARAAYTDRTIRLRKYLDPEPIRR